MSDQVTAPSLRDRIIRAIEDVSHEPGTGTPCEPCELCAETADAVMAVLADADPTDLGLEQVGWFVRFPSGIEAIRPRTPFTNDSDMGRQQPVYARPRPEETTDD